MSRIGHTAAGLGRDLRAMGIRASDVLIVHSSMRSIGRVAGGPQTVIRALELSVGPSGSILMPTFTYSLDKVYEPAEPFDPSSSPALTGLIPETFRRSDGVLRSLHPTHSVAAWGKSASRYVEGHEARSAFDADTPLHRASRDDAVVLMIGCTFTTLSLLHVAEALAELPYLGLFCWWHRGWKPEALRALPGGKVERVNQASSPGCSLGFGALQEEAERAGLLRHAPLGDSTVLVFRARAVLDFAVARLKEHPDALLCPPATCRACDERRMVLEELSPGAGRIRSFLVDMAGRTGIRVAGSPAELEAAELIASRFDELGLANSRVEDFAVPVWEPGYATLSVTLGGARSEQWRALPAAPCAHAPATPARGTEGDLVDIESMADLAKLGDGAGRIAVLWDGYGASERAFRALMSRGFSGFVYVDRRFSHGERVAVGFPAGWLKHLTAPMVSVPFPDAADLLGRPGARARMHVTGDVHAGASRNAIAEIPGSLEETIVVCAHHDSTFNSVAMDDNLTGVAALLEIARALLGEGRAPRRTVRFCSFGAEELLSEGARSHALDSGGARAVCLVLNNDSMGARVGSTDVCVTGPAELGDWLRRRSRATELQFRLAEDVSPFSDHFPFNAAGTPSLWFYRPTLATGRHFHHTTGDSLGVLDLEHIASLAAFQAALVRELAFAPHWPFPSGIPAPLGARIARAAEEWLGVSPGAARAGRTSRSGRTPQRGRASG